MPLYTWQQAPQSSQSSSYFPYIRERLSFDDDQDMLFDARSNLQWLTIEGEGCSPIAMCCCRIGIFWKHNKQGRVYLRTDHALSIECTKTLTCAGLVEELGFKIRGTTDVALVQRSAVRIGHAVTGIRWLWELKKDPQAHAAVSEQVRISGPASMNDSSKVLFLVSPAESARSRSHMEHDVCMIVRFMLKSFRTCAGV